MSSTTTKAAAAPVLPAALRLGAVHLTVPSLDRSIAWYERALGLRVHERAGDRAALGDGHEAVLVLHEDPQAQRARRAAGLYHVALLYPSREALARAARRLAATRTPIQGASDHDTHEAIYLPDADGIGLELAADRPREQWPAPEAAFADGPRPLDLDALLAAAPDEDPAPAVAPGLRVGHVHLHVADVDRALAFYRDTLGFEVWARMPSAAFVSAGGYHHHVGMNTWHGAVTPAPPHTLGLDHWTVALPAAQDVADVRARAVAASAPVEDTGEGIVVRDPWGIAVAVVAGAAA